MNKIEKDLLGWQERERKFAATFPEGALQSKAFQKVKHREMMIIYRKHRGAARNLDERVSLAMLRAANKGMEKQLYPNRVERYTRRFFRSVRNGVASLAGNIAARRNARRQADVDIWIQPQVQKPGVFQNKAPAIQRMAPRKTTQVQTAKKSKGISR